MSLGLSAFLVLGCFSEPGEAVGDSSTSEEDLSSSGCEGVIDACGVCDGSGSPCFGCTVPQASDFDPLADTYDGTCTCTPSGTPLADAAQLDSNAGAGGMSQWQSFTSEVGGGLHSISIDLASPLGEEPAAATLNVYQGEGNTGTRITSVEIEIESVQLSVVQEFEFDDLIPIARGEVYTWELTVPEVTVGFLALNNSDPYAGGRYSADEGTDAVFRVDVLTCAAE